MGLVHEIDLCQHKTQLQLVYPSTRALSPYKSSAQHRKTLSASGGIKRQLVCEAMPISKRNRTGETNPSFGGAFAGCPVRSSVM